MKITPGDCKYSFWDDKNEYLNRMFFYGNLIVKKEYKSIAAGIEWADECLQLIG